LADGEEDKKKGYLPWTLKDMPITSKAWSSTALSLIE
jgi:hypothetical protein